MSDIKNLINIILSDEKLKNSKNFEQKIYQDEPIIRTAKQMSNYLPPEYREMRKIAKTQGYAYESDEQTFYNQGKFMEDFEDDFEFHGNFVRYFPTYQSMNDIQLRGYFSWRTKVRHGIIEQTSDSFAFVYIYELLNQIGVKSPEEGFHTLKSFWMAYREFCPALDHYVIPWLNDYTVYYNLDKSLLEEISNSGHDSALMILFDYKSHSEDEIFNAIKVLSSYKIENSRFYKQYPDDFKAVVCGVFDRLSEYYSVHRQKSLCESLFGRKISLEYHIFYSAVFYDRMRYKKYEYEFSSIHRYTCRHGKWTCEKFYGDREKKRKLGHLIKTIDCIMRRSYGFNHSLMQEDTTKYRIDIIEKETDKFLELKKKNAAPKIEIDISKLRGIREAADITRDKLIVDEINNEESDEATALHDTLINEPGANNTPLDETEYRFMQCLLYGGDYSALIKERGTMLSVLSDSVNEKLFDEFGDNVIEFDGDTPELIEDYSDDLKEMIHR